MKIIATTRGTAVRVAGKLNRFATNLPKMSKRGRRQLAERFRDYSITNISNWRRYPSRRGSQGLTNPATWEIREEVNTTEVIPRATAVSAAGAFEYAEFVEYGTKPHEIPNNPMWGMIGKMHPGAAPNRFMGPALERIRAETSPRFKELIRQSLAEAGIK